MGKFYYFVAADCLPDLEDKFNRWFDQTHIPLLQKFSKLKKAFRYRLAEPKAVTTPPVKKVGDWPRYLTVYEFDDLRAGEEYLKSPELQAAAQEMKGSWKEEEIQVKWRAFYELLGTFE